MATGSWGASDVMTMGRGPMPMGGWRAGQGSGDEAPDKRRCAGTQWPPVSDLRSRSARARARRWAGTGGVVRLTGSRWGDGVFLCFDVEERGQAKPIGPRWSHSGRGRVLLGLARRLSDGGGASWLMMRVWRLALLGSGSAVWQRRRRVWVKQSRKRTDRTARVVAAAAGVQCWFGGVRGPSEQTKTHVIREDANYAQQLQMQGVCVCACACARVVDGLAVDEERKSDRS